MNRQTNGQTDKHMDRLTNGQTDRQEDRQSYYAFCSGISLCVAAESVVCSDVCLCVFMAHMISVYISDSQCRGGVDRSGTDPTTGGQMDGAVDQGWHWC